MADPQESGEQRRSDESLRLLVESVKDYAIFLLDPGGHIVSWNDGAQRIKGWTAEEIVGRHFSTFYTEDAVASDHPAHELEIAGREGRYEEEGWRVRKDGTLFWANVVITALYADSGELVGFGKVTRDMTERKRNEEELREARAELERRRLSQRQALEINDNILQGLVLAQYALQRDDRETQERAIASTLAEARRIISELLADAHVKSGELRRLTGTQLDAPDALAAQEPEPG
jgi:PAS domain S-box-containing protein